MAVRAKKPKEAKPVVVGLHAFHFNITQCRPEQVPSYVADIYHRVFGIEPPERVHWWLLKRAIGYELMFREGKLKTKELVDSYRRALKLDVSLIEDCKERNLLLSLMRVEGARQDRPVASELPSGKAITKENPMAAKKKAVKKNPAKKVAAKKAPVAGKRGVGATSGLGIQKCWFAAFVLNAKAKKVDRLTDAGIADYMESEFPESTSKSIRATASARRVCNAGGVKDCEAPAKPFVSYDEDGEVKAKAAKAVPAKKAPAKKAAKKPAKKAAKKAAKKK
jgi:hypothetical protein